VLTLALLWLGTARADNACPSRAAVESAVAELGSRERSAPGLDERTRQSLELTDLGTRFRVALAGRTREYADEERDCERRTRLAAVFIALVLRGDEATETPPPAASETTAKAVPVASSAPPAAIRASSPPSEARRQAWFFVDAAARVAFAPSDVGLVVLPGAELGASFLPGRLGVRIALAAPFAKGTLEIGPASARVARYPLSLLGRCQLRLEPFVAALDAGAEGALLTVAREDGSHAQTRLDVAGRLGLSLGLARSRVSPILSALVELVPVRFPLALEPDGVLTKTPALWLGATAGVSSAF
jgi:hypothetical protein